MAIVLAATPDETNADNQMYDRIQKTKEDAEKLVQSDKMMEVLLRKTICMH